MFHSILVPLDLSDRNARALEHARELLAPEGHLTLLHAVELIPGFDESDEPAFYQRLEKAARSRLEAHVTDFGPDAPEVEVVVKAGRRVEAIIGWAQDWQVDLIVLASHRIDPSSPVASWGALSYQIGLLAPCTVLLVK